MAFDYVGKLTAVYNLLDDANTTTASIDLSSGLDSRIKRVSMSDVATVNLRNYEFPAVFVKLDSKSEDFEDLGRTGAAGSTKMADVDFQVVGLYKKYGATTDNDALLADVYKLADNIESVIRADCTASGTASWIGVTNTDFIGPFEGEGVLVKGVLINIKGRYYFR